MKLVNLKEKGIISEDEFQQMKQDLIKKKKI
jgi:Short C-terminal domain